MAVPTAIRGRFFSTLLDQCLRFYERHRVTIDAVISSVAIAALETLISELPGIISSLNPPGPG